MAESKDIVNLFFSHVSSLRYVFPNGTEAAFIAGQYATSNEEEIQHLDSEIKLGHPAFFRKQDQLSCERADLDPMEALKKKHFAEFLAMQEAQKKSESFYAVSPLSPSTSATLVDIKTPEELLAAAEATKSVFDLSSLLTKK